MSRVERLLKAIIQNGEYNEERLSRIEDILYSFLKDNEYIEDPMSRIEALLITLKNKGMYSNDILSRVEAILKAKIDGEDYPYEPESRVEELLLLWNIVSDKEVYIHGVPPLKLENSVGKDLKDWSITGDTKQDSGTYTGVAKDVTAVGIEDDTDYPYFNTTDFENVAVGDKVNFSASGLSYPMTAKKIESNDIYFENPGVDGTASGVSPLVLENTNGKELNSWSITGNTVQDGEPTPTEPIEVKGVGDKTGNLLNVDDSVWNGLYNGVQYSTSNDIVRINGISDGGYMKKQLVNLVNNTYTLSIEITGTLNNQESHTFNLTVNGKRFMLVFSKTGKYSINVTGEITEFYTIINSNFDGDIYCKIMLNEGSTALPYEPYGYKVPVVAKGENYLSSELEIGTLSASEGLPVTMYTRLRTKDFTVLNPGTYTVEATALNGEDLYGLAFEYDVNTEAFIRRMPEAWTKMPFTFTIDTQRKIKFLVSKTNGGTDKIYPSEIKFAGITNGDTKTSTIYLPSPLMADEVLKSDGSREVEWGVVKIRELTDIRYDVSTKRFIAFFDKIKKSTSPRTTRLYCECYDCLYNGESYDKAKNNNIYSGAYGKMESIFIHDNRFTTIEDFFASMGDVEIYYPLATPTTETVDVPAIPTLKGNCVLDTDTEVKPTNMAVEYTKSIDFTKPVNRSYSISYPSPTHISEVKGVGDYDAETGKYKITAVSKGKNLCPPLIKGISLSSVNGGQMSNDYGATSDFIKVDFNYATRYYFSGMPNDRNNFIAAYDKDYKFVGRTGGSTSTDRYVLKASFSSGTPQSSNEPVYLRLTTYGQSKPLDYEIMVSNDSIPYEPYIEPITTPIYLPSPLMADEVLKSDGSREVEFKKMVLTGDENWASWKTYGITIRLKDLYKDAVSNIRAYSTHFAANYSSWNRKANAEIMCSSDFVILTFSDDISVEDAVAFIKSEYDAGHPVTIYYQLAEPTTETIDVPSIPTLRGNSVMDVETALLPKDMGITYFVDVIVTDGVPIRTGNGDVLYTADGEPLCTEE